VPGSVNADTSVVSLVRFGSIAKVRDVVGLYLAPPGHAVVYALKIATIGGTR
jgi:hypothetical protein